MAAELQRRGHETVAAAPSTGFDTISGAGVAEGLMGAEVVVDVSNAPSFEAAAVLEFFRTSTGTLLAAEQNARVAHHLVLSIVGADRAPDSGTLRSTAGAQQRRSRLSGRPIGPDMRQIDTPRTRERRKPGLDRLRCDGHAPGEHRSRAGSGP